MLLAASPVKELAQMHGIRVEQPKSLKDPAAQAMLAQLECDLMVVAAYGLILPQAVLDLPRLGCINIHASLLPRWRGAAPIVRAIEHGDTQTGICIMRMEAGLDTGPVYSTHRLPIRPTATAAVLHDELAQLGGVALLEALPGIAKGTLIPIEQAADGVTYASKITKDEAPLDWSQKTEELVDKIRAFDPFPGTTTLWRGEVIKIWAAKVWTAAARGDNWPAQSSPLPGCVLACTSDSFVVATGDGAIEVTAIQKAGAKRVSGKSMRQSVPIAVGECFGATTHLAAPNSKLPNLES